MIHPDYKLEIIIYFGGNMKSFDSLSISKKISFTVFAILCLTLSIYLVVFFLNNDSSVKNRIEQDNEQLSSLLTESIKLAMAAGADDTKPFITNLEKFDKIKEVRIVPTDIIDNKSQIKFDAFEEKTLNSDLETNCYEDFEGSKVLRSIKFLRADKSCLDCHDAKENDILAVVSIRQSLDETYAELASQKIDAAWIGLLAAIITLV